MLHNLRGLTFLISFSLPRELKISSFKSELNAKTPRATDILQMIPHIIPHREVPLYY